MRFLMCAIATLTKQTSKAKSSNFEPLADLIMQLNLPNSKFIRLDWISSQANAYIKNRFQERLAAVDIQINGTRAWDIQVHNENFYTRVLLQGSLGLGEAYVEGWWDCSQLDEFFSRLLRGLIHEQVAANSFVALWEKLKTKILNLQTLARSFQVGQHHYDLGNDLFVRMLDPQMVYSCGYWQQAKTLEEAQTAKLDLICQKLQLQPGMTLLDIGCGWGSLMKYAAEHYGVSCVGVTVSQEQVQLGKQRCQGLPIQFLLQDYRECQGQFDRVVSVGMFEHVGYKNYPLFMEVAHRCLAEDGLFLLHTIGNRNSITYGELWTGKYIFPNGMMPSIAQISSAIESLFVIEDLHNFGSDYTPTLLAWLNNFEQTWDQLSEKYGEKFYRIWRYFLSSTAGSFRARHLQVWQIVFSKNGVLNGYKPVR